MIPCSASDDAAVAYLDMVDNNQTWLRTYLPTNMSGHALAVSRVNDVVVIAGNRDVECVIPLAYYCVFFFFSN